ncbi:MAG TPA: hypothetical protein VK705_03180 [Ferruginibacter sp.]|jgi:hypothetical protein|nr:hypothetical protein [Ferruginibacter sp.]
MKKNNLFIYAVLLFVGIVIFSCKKTASNVLTGNWKLTAVHSRIITPGAVVDTSYYDSTYNPAASQILEFNGNNTYSITDYSKTPPAVIYGKYTFSGASIGTMVMTPNLTDSMLNPIAINNTYIITPSNSVANSTLVLITSTTIQGSAVSDSSYYVYF